MTAAGPKISCLMVSRGLVFPARFAVECYQRQTYPDRELVVVTSRKDSELGGWLEALGDPSIRYIETGEAPLGALRNVSVAAARGELVSVWDDDDLYHPQRLEVQARLLERTGAAAHLSQQLMIWWPQRRRLGLSNRRPWENSMLARRALLPEYPEVSLSEDKQVVVQLRERHPVTVTSVPALYCYVIHGNNSWHQAHFEEIWRCTERKVTDAAYDAQLARLADRWPMADYVRGLLDRSPAPARPDGG
jgi:glycosyltransferase involved in cell wall biosynthesis